MAIYKLDYVNDEVVPSINEGTEPILSESLYKLPNGDFIYLTNEFTKYHSELWVDKYLEATVAESASFNEN